MNQINPETFKISIAGVMSVEILKCFTCARELKTLHPESVLEFEYKVMFPTQWDLYLKKLQNEKKGEFYNHTGSPLIYLNDATYVGGCENFMEWALQQFRYIDNTSQLIYKKMAIDSYKTTINDTPGRSYVYMNISYSGNPAEKVLIELFDDICPKTCENFKKLC